ncbi:hypothetical protein GPECTOR_4g871 [Gonium pectorale]|uniref:DNA replication licensing factor MCM2 n=1 Tax=Gonium pectorale TaxID=33097 RepID=A0A150GZP7_GONPE|nr:hypothetical protein GPECTOR_4g871 [Gonium pectorale]|eukprot:KXZ54800.1 hypothetical protein GPECTOR_4g871 [Gonium pectorale]
MDGETNPLDQYDPVEEEDAVEEEEEGEDLMENMERDYQAQPHLDHYDPEGLDDEDVDDNVEDPVAARLAAEEELNRRDATKLRPRRTLPDILMQEDDDGPQRGDFNRRRKRRHSFDPAPSDTHDAAPLDLDIEEVKGRLTEWIAQEQVAAEIKRRFRHFLRNYPNDNPNGQPPAAAQPGGGRQPEMYMDRIRAMCKDNKRSLELEYSHWAEFQPTLSIWVADAPKQMLEYLDEAATEVVQKVFSDNFFDMWRAYGEEYSVHVRLVGLPISDSLRDLRNYHLNCLVRVSGVVTRRTGVFPQLRLIKYDCVKCGHVLGPFAMHTETEVRPNSCPSCQSKGPFMVNSSETVYRDYQKLTLQESPGSVPAGRLPRHKEVILTHDLIDCARPGEEVEVTGLYVYGYDASLNVKNSFPVFSTHIEANFVSKREDVYSMHALTDDDKARVLELSRDPRIGNLASIWLVDKLGRRLTACVCMAGACGCALLFAAAPPHGVWPLLAACVFNGVSVGGWNSLDMISAELYPTSLRSSGFGFLNALGRVSSFATTYAAGALLERALWAPLALAAALLAAGSAAMLSLPEPAGKPLQDSFCEEDKEAEADGSSRLLGAEAGEGGGCSSSGRASGDGSDDGDGGLGRVRGFGGGRESASEKVGLLSAEVAVTAGSGGAGGGQ